MYRSRMPKTADLCDAHEGKLRVLEPGLRHFGGVRTFHGPVTTLAVHEDNALVRGALEESGAGRVLVVDGGGSLRTALLGGNLAELARANGWAGVVVQGAVRDAIELAATAVGVVALATMPQRSGKTGAGARDVPVLIAGVHIAPGEHLYADEDGIVLSASPL